MSPPWATVAALALLQSVLPAPMLPASATGTLAGVVLEADTGAPIPGATVHTIGPAARRLSTARSGLDGRWRLRGLPPGVYRIIALAPGFAPVRVEPSPSSGLPADDSVSGHGIRLAAGGERRELVARLERAGSISGRVTNAAGVPVPDLVVTVEGAPVMGAPRVGQAVTGRDGRYRLEAVAAGERLVMVLPNRMPSGRAPDRGWSRFFHPGTDRRDEARTVTVRAGEHAGGIDIVVSLPTARVIMGRLVVPAGAEEVHVRLVSNGGRTLRNLSYRPADGVIGPDIVEGAHRVVWARGRVGDRLFAAWQSLDPIGDGELSPMSLVPTGTVRGRLVSASGGPVPSGRLVAGSVLWTGGEGFEIIGEREAEVSADGSFELGGILGPRRLSVRGVPSAWSVVDVRMAGTSVLDSGIDVGPAQMIDGVEVVIGER